MKILNNNNYYYCLSERNIFWNFFCRFFTPAPGKDSAASRLSGYCTKQSHACWWTTSELSGSKNNSLFYSLCIVWLDMNFTIHKSMSELFSFPRPKSLIYSMFKYYVIGARNNCIISYLKFYNSYIYILITIFLAAPVT